MNVDQKEWESKLNNLHTRTKGISSEHQIEYKKLISSVFIGNTVLDIGCGTCWAKNYIPKSSKYYGIDAISKPEHKGLQIFSGSIEMFEFGGKTFDTLFVFAALDGMLDLKKAFENMKKIAAKNIVILTGINIDPDLYHTHLITEDFIDQQMIGFDKTVRNQIHPKIVFLEYTKI